MTKLKKSKKIHLKIYVLFSVFLFVFGTVFILNQKSQNGKIASIEPKKSLQIGTFYITPRPNKPPSNNRPLPYPTRFFCGHDDGTKMIEGCVCTQAIVITCKNNKCVSAYIDNKDITCMGGMLDSYCEKWALAGDGSYCVAKPVVYLYPEKDTLVNVRVVTEGKVVISDPQIENGNAWTNVMAHPDGKLTYQNKQYRELFYESESTTLNAPTKGLIIKRNELKSKLKEYITILGLTRADEQDEFLEFWVPRLQALNFPYIFFSILDSSEKHRLDQVFITPRPDVFIEFIAYFKPMDKIEPISQLELIPAPKRAGFTAVEWGGVIDH